MLVAGLGVLMVPPPTPPASLLQLEPLDSSLLQQKPNVNAVATLEKVIEIQSENLRPGWGHRPCRGPPGGPRGCPCHWGTRDGWHRGVPRAVLTIGGP